VDLDQPQQTSTTRGNGGPITPQMDRRNGLAFSFSYLLIFFAAPVIYVRIDQAALCDKLGASATVSNLPASAYLLGGIAPVFLTWLVPARFDREMVIFANVITAVVLALVVSTLLFPFGNTVRIAALVGQGLFQGVSSSVSLVYQFQCLGRGTTLEGRARALKIAYGLGPATAVLGSLGAQFVLGHGIPALKYPFDFAFLYLVAIPCMLGVAWVSTRYQLPPVEPSTASGSFPGQMLQGIRSYLQNKPLVRLWLAYFFWYCTLNLITNLSLYAKEAIGRDPKELSGVMMALRFGFKAAAGFVLPSLALRSGVRAPLTATVLLLLAATVWGWFVPGYYFLIAFGLMGAGELGGGYFPNYVVAISPGLSGSRNLALLNLATPAGSLAPALYGRITDVYGFSASFVLGIVVALLSLILVLTLPAGPALEAKPQ